MRRWFPLFLATGILTAGCDAPGTTPARRRRSGRRCRGRATGCAARAPERPFPSSRPWSSARPGGRRSTRTASWWRGRRSSTAPTGGTRTKLDDRLPPKERVLGLPQGSDGGIAFPFSELEARALRAVPSFRNGRPVVVLWSDEHRTAAAYYTDSGDRETTLETTGEGFRDRETGSRWTVLGEAVEGPRSGERLERVSAAYVAFWFARAAFQTETIIWQPR